MIHLRMSIGRVTLVKAVVLIQSSQVDERLHVTKVRSNHCRFEYELGSWVQPTRLWFIGSKDPNIMGWSLDLEDGDDTRF